MELSKIEKRILRNANRVDKFTVDGVDKKSKTRQDVMDAVNRLVKDGYILADTNPRLDTRGGIVSIRTGVYRISPKGRAYLENKVSAFIREWLPITISTIALISSFRAEILWLVRLIAQLWKK